jgi:tyrosyl-tRNA synthetase
LREWFELLTDRSTDEIDKLLDASTVNPRDAKLTLGKDIVCFYHGAEAATAAEAEWRKRFSGKQDPTVIPEVNVPAAELTDGKMWVCKLLVDLKMATSKNEARRLVEGGAVNVGPDREPVTDPKANVPVTDGLIVRAGSKKVFRVKLV